MVRKGEMAPRLEVSDHAGVPQSIATLSGSRGLVLLFYRGYW